MLSNLIFFFLSSRVSGPCRKITFHVLINELTPSPTSNISFIKLGNWETGSPTSHHHKLMDWMSKNLWFTISIALSLTQLSVHLPEIYPSHNPWVLLKIFHLSICRVQFICPIFLSFFCKQYSGLNYWLGAVAIISLCGFKQYKWEDPRGIKWCWGSKGKNLFLPSESLESPTFVKSNDCQPDEE